MTLVRGWRTVGRRELVPLAALGVLNPGLAYTLSMLGLAEIPASMTTLLWAAEPTLIVIFAWLLLSEPITERVAMLTAMAACGVVLVSGVAGGNVEMTGNLKGPALVLGGVTCCALYTALSRRYAMAADPLHVVTIQQTAGLMWTMAIWPAELSGDGARSLGQLGRGELVGGALTGLMYYVAAFWFYIHALRKVQASTAGLYLNLIPVFGVAGACLALGERLTSAQWAGGIIILLAVVLMARQPSPP